MNTRFIPVEDAFTLTDIPAFYDKNTFTDSPALDDKNTET